MTLDEIGKLLRLVVANDGRTTGEADAVIWTAALQDLEYSDCEQAVLEHVRDGVGWLAPAMVRRSVKAARADRLARQLDLPPDADPDDVPAYQAALRAGRLRLAGPVSPRDMTAIEGTFPAVPAADVPEWNRVREELARRAPRPIDLTYGESMRQLAERFPTKVDDAPADPAQGGDPVDVGPDPGGLHGAYAADDQLVVRADRG